MKIAFMLSAILLGVIIMSCSGMGSKPDNKRVEKYRNSKNYNYEKKEFVNRVPDIIDRMWKRNISFSMFKTMFKSVKDIKPKKPIPELKPDMKKFLEKSDDLKIIWFGHSTFLLNMNGKIILVDPIFSTAAAPVSFAVRRFQKPVLSLEELPKIDFILISHDHYDHLDMDSVSYFKDHDLKYLVPLGVGSHLEGWSIPKEKIIEKDWWEIENFDGLEFIATPAQHFSGRSLTDRNKTLWASWVIKTDKHRVYFSGDSGYDIHYKQIGEKYGPFDVAFIESGQYNKKWEEVHMLPEQGVQAYKDLKAKRYFPIHWGMFVLARHSWYDPAEQLTKLSKMNKVNLLIPKIGQQVNLEDEFVLENWWNKGLSYFERIKSKIVLND